MANRGIRIPAETMLALRTRLTGLPPRSAARREEVGRIAGLFGVSPSTVYRALKSLHQPKGLRRSDRGKPRGIQERDLARYCEIIAALKMRTSNRKGRHLSTTRAIELLEEHGVQTPEGHVQPPKGLLKRSTVNRWLKDWGYDQPRMTRAAPATRFEARHSNACWQFDISPSDLKHIAQPAWLDPKRGQPTMMLYSVVDDRSGTSYQEYRCVYGEDAESALRFLFNAMSPKEDTEFQGIPGMIYLDNGPVAKSLVFQTVMERLGVEWKTHKRYSWPFSSRHMNKQDADEADIRFLHFAGAAPFPPSHSKCRHSGRSNGVRQPRSKPHFRRMADLRERRGLSGHMRAKRMHVQNVETDARMCRNKIFNDAANLPNLSFNCGGIDFSKPLSLSSADQIPAIDRRITLTCPSRNPSP